MEEKNKEALDLGQACEVGFEHVAVEAIGDELALAGRLDQAGDLELLHVVGDGGGGDLSTFAKLLAGERVAGLADAAEQIVAAGVGEGSGDAVEACVGESSGGHSVYLRRGLLGGEAFADVLGHGIDGGLPAELLDGLVARDRLQAHALGDLTVDAEHSGDLFFGEQKDLKHQVVALFIAAAYAGLAHEDKAAEQDGFEREERAEQREGRGIEVPNADVQRVREHPGEEDEQMREDEAEAADAAGYPVAKALGAGAAVEKLLLVAGDEIDVFLNVFE